MTANNHLIFGYDSTPSSNTACLAKEVKDRGLGCAILLYACGSVMAADAVMDAVPFTLSKAEATLRQSMDEILHSGGADDLLYAVTSLTTVCKDLNREIIDISDYLGQGIYLGGVIMYHTYRNYALLPFGGGHAYRYENETLSVLGVQYEDPFARNALGASRSWDCEFIQGDYQEGLHFLFTSKKIPDIEAAAGILTEHISNRSHPNTISMLLKRLLDQEFTYPAAVMELQN